MAGTNPGQHGCFWTMLELADLRMTQHPTKHDGEQRWSLIGGCLVVLLFNLLYCEFRPSADLTLQVGGSFAVTNVHQVLSDCVRYSLGADERRKPAANDCRIEGQRLPQSGCDGAVAARRNLYNMGTVDRSNGLESPHHFDAFQNLRTYPRDSDRFRTYRMGTR